MEYRKRPVVVDAVQWDGKFGDGVGDFSWMLRLESQMEKCPLCKRPMKEHGQIMNSKKGKRRGGDVICPGDWIITETDGERIGCRAKDFESRYMPSSLPTDSEAVDKVAKWLNSVIENGEPYDEVENMAWNELAGGEKIADAFRELAAGLLNNYLPMALGVAERAKKHPPEKRTPSGRGKSE